MRPGRRVSNNVFFIISSGQHKAAVMHVDEEGAHDELLHAVRQQHDEHDDGCCTHCTHKR